MDVFLEEMEEGKEGRREWVGWVRHKLLGVEESKEFVFLHFGVETVS